MPQERVARVRFFDEGVLLPQVEESSLYDLNPHPGLQYDLGDHVLIRSRLLPPTGLVEEVVNLAAGFVEGLVRSVTDFDGSDVSTGHQRAQSGFTTDKVDWMGEVAKINSDGTVTIRLAREAEPPLNWEGERFTVVKGEDLIVLEVDNDEEEDEMENIIDAEDWLDDVAAVVWEDESNDSDEEWEDASEGDMGVDIPEASLDGIDNEVHPLVPVHASTDLEDPSSPMGIAPPTVDTLEWGITTEKCSRFDILEVVPSDHPFKSDNVNTDQGREWITRIRKEHRILQSSLPGKRGLGIRAYTVEGILVRTYESRLDLMRVLILGPKNTPYENAPFLFDFSLADKFPTEPPEAFFHSWTPGGNGGRVNPNLYVYVTPYPVH